MQDSSLIQIVNLKGTVLHALVSIQLSSTRAGGLSIKEMGVVSKKKILPESLKGITTQECCYLHCSLTHLMIYFKNNR